MMSREIIRKFARYISPVDTVSKMSVKKMYFRTWTLLRTSLKASILVLVLEFSYRKIPTQRRHLMAQIECIRCRFVIILICVHEVRLKSFYVKSRSIFRGVIFNFYLPFFHSSSFKEMHCTGSLKNRKLNQYHVKRYFILHVFLLIDQQFSSS